MTPLLILKDEDIFGAEAVSEPDINHHKSEDRLAVKVIMLDHENKIALVGTKYRLLPGGGVEEGESLVEAAVRECREETGCDVVFEQEIGFTEEYRAKIGRKQTTYCLVAKVVGEKGLPISEQEDEKDIEVEWFNLAEAITKLEEEVVIIPRESYHSCFNVRTHLAFLKKFKEDIS